MGKQVFQRGLSDKAKKRYVMFLDRKTLKEIAQIENVLITSIKQSIELAKSYYANYELYDLRIIRRSLGIKTHFK